MNPAHPLLDELHAHRIHIERHGRQLKLRAPQRPPDGLLHRLRRHKADLLALLPDTHPMQRAILYFRLPCHSTNAWATMIGLPGETREMLTAHLLERWPEAMLQTDPAGGCDQAQPSLENAMDTPPAGERKSV